MHKNRLRRRAWRAARVLATLPAAVAIFIAPPNIAVAQEAAPLTLRDAITRAMEADPALQASSFGIDAARGGLRQARVRPNPVLSAEVENFNGSGELRGFQGAETTFSVNQEVELGGRRKARVRLADRDLHGAELDYLVRGLDLIRDVQAAYFDALAANELVLIERERLTTAEALNVAVTRRVGAARDPLMAGARAQAGLAEARIALARAEAEAANARSRLASLLGGDAGFVLVRDHFNLPSDNDHVHSAPGDANPDVARLIVDRDRATASLAVERSLAWQNPTLSVGVRRFDERGGDQALVAGVSIPLGLFDRNQGAIARARAQQRQADLNVDAGRRVLQRQFGSFQQAMLADAVAVRATETDVIPQAERALALAQDGYNRGAFSYLDVLEAQRALADARQRRVEALRSYHSNEAALDRLTARFANDLPDLESHR